MKEKTCMTWEESMMNEIEILWLQCEKQLIHLEKEAVYELEQVQKMAVNSRFQ